MSIKVQKGDITKIKVDVIVNAANSSLLGGGGVDGAIHRAGGPEILEECKTIGGCRTGEAVMTTAGKLPAQKVIHTVGPVWNKGDDSEMSFLGKCYENSIRLAAEKGYKSIAFPNISTGVYRFPKKLAAQIAIKTVKDCLKQHSNLDVIFVCFDDENFRLYNELPESSAP